MVELRPMTVAELTGWLVGQREAYVADRIAAGEPEDVARHVAAEQHAEYFPDGRPAERHEVFVVESDGSRVGVVWAGPYPRRPEDPAAAWLYDIEIAEERRGQGLGRVVLELLERHLAGQGVTELALNVFGGNDRARRLYAAAGYREVAITMSKPLGGAS